jgi:hypothetical protein
MPGSPNRPSRDAYGPTYINERAVRNVNKELPAEIGNLMMWQLAGAGLVLPKAKLLIDGATATVIFQGLTFDPNGELPALVVTRNGAGDYEVDFSDANFDDQDGNSVALAMQWAEAKAVLSASSALSFQESTFIASATKIEVKIYDATGAGAPALADSKFALAVF